MIPIKKNFYKDGVGSGEIAMPPLDEKPPVLDANEWSGTNQQQQQQPEPVQKQEIEEEVEEQEVEEIEEEVEEQEEAPAPQFKNKSQEGNFKALRERAEKAEREREELMKYVLESKRSDRSEQPQQKIQEIPEEESEFDFTVDDDALIEGKQAKRLAAELKKMKQQMKAFQSQSQESVVEAKIKNQFPDFDAVVNQENVAQLNAEYPEIAATLRDTKDLYSKATAAYKIMKKFGIYRDKTYDQDKALAVKNATKPRTVTSLNPQQGDSPLSKANAFANGMSKDLQKQLLKEMSEARRNI